MMTKPRIQILRLVDGMDLDNPSDEDKAAILSSGFSFLVFLTEICGLFDMQTDFHVAISAVDEGTVIFQ